MERPNTWHRGAPPSHLLKHGSRAIVSALVLDGDEFGIADGSFARQGGQGGQGPEEKEEENGGDGR